MEREKESHGTEGGRREVRPRSEMVRGWDLKIEPWQQSEVGVNETGWVTKAPSQFINQSRPAGRQQPEQPGKV